MTSCIHIDLCTGLVSEKAPMIVGRSYHGVAHVSNHIYVVAGRNEQGFDDTTSERYHIPTNKWERFDYQFGRSG